MTSSTIPGPDGVPRRSRRWPARLGAGAAAGLAMSLLLIPAAAAGDSGRTRVLAQDRCDPATFNAAVGPGTCVGDGNVTFGELVETLNPEDFGHNAWRFSREDTHIDHGDHIVVRNTGGEFHTFSQVQNFGPGVVPPLNAVFPEGTPDAVPIGDPFASGMDPGDATTVSGLAPGTHLFQCIIHPWMQTTVVVRHH